MTDTNKYIDTDNVSGGRDGSPGNPYNTHGEWQTAEVDTIAGGDRHIVNAVGNTTNGGFTLNGWTVTDVDGLQLIGNAVDMTWDDSKITFAGAGNTLLILSQDNCIFKNYQIDSTRTSNGVAAVWSTAYDEVKVVGCIVRHTGTGLMRGIYLQSTSSGHIQYAINNSINNFGREGLNLGGNAAVKVGYNNTIEAAGVDGVVCGGNGLKYLKNTISTNAGTSDYGTMTNLDASSTNNLSSDATASGASPLTNKTVTYVNAANDDLSLAAGDTSGAKLGGADLDADAQYAVTDDKEGTARHATTPCIGAHEFVSAVGVTGKSHPLMGPLGGPLAGPIG